MKKIPITLPYIDARDQKKVSNAVVIKALNKAGKKIDIECDVVLVAVGRKPNTKNFF